MESMNYMWRGLLGINTANLLIQTGNLFHIPPLIGIGVVGMILAILYWGWAIMNQKQSLKKAKEREEEAWRVRDLERDREFDRMLANIQAEQEANIQRARQEAMQRKAEEDARVISEAVAITKKKARKGKIDLSKGPSIDISKHPLDRNIDLN